MDRDVINFNYLLGRDASWLLKVYTKMSLYLFSQISVEFMSLHRHDLIFDIVMGCFTLFVLIWLKYLIPTLSLM